MPDVPGCGRQRVLRGGELRTTIRDDFVVKSETKEDFVEEKISDSFGGD